MIMTNDLHELKGEILGFAQMGDFVRTGLPALETLHGFS